MADSDLNLHQILLIAMPVVGVVGLLGNFLVCLTICCNRTLHNVTNLTIFNLAIADLLVSVFVSLNSFYTVTHHAEHPNGTQCSAGETFQHNSVWVFLFFLNSSTSHSVLCLTLVCFEQFIGINRPLKYPSYFTRRRITAMLLAVWGTPLIAYLPRTFLMTALCYSNNCLCKTKESLFSAIATLMLLFLPTAAIIWMYFRIIITLKRGARNLEEQGIQGPAQELHQARRKVTGILVVVVTAFFIFVIPGAVWFLVSTLTHSFLSREVEANIWHSHSLLASMNSSINPVLYAFKYEQLRKGFKAMVCRCYRWRPSFNQIGPL